MSGRELENALALIDENIESTQQRVWDEVMAYLRNHEPEAISELSAHQRMAIPTSVGVRVVSLDDLKTLVR